MTRSRKTKAPHAPGSEPPAPQAPEGLPQAPEGLPQAPEGLPQPPEVLPQAPAKVPEQATTLALPIHPTFPESRLEEDPFHRPRKRFWFFGILAVLILGGSLAYYFLTPSGDTPAAAAGDGAPAEVRPYLDRAAQGDSSAMRMLGTMYYNGLNVPQDRREGVKWYRKAAAAGNVAAKRDLEQLGLAVEETK